ncbi:MAG: hypothetical protein HY866_21660 [Chloroflexi bacterium]|nr:hypothetical protein [Chloroflexota bacterium]
MANLAPLTKNEVEKMVVDWYLALDVHKPIAEVMQFVSESELEMVFPEATLHNLAEAEKLVRDGWYRLFFDEVHTMQSLDIKLSPDGQRADIKLVVRWEASKWTPPAPNSERLKMDAYQTWVVKRSPASGKAVITRYVVDELKLLPGSAPL